MSKLRTINIDPQFLSMSKKKQKTQKTNIPLNEVKLNSNNIRELLLEKLKQHKKNKKTLKNPLVQLNTMDEQTSNIPDIMRDNVNEQMPELSKPNELSRPNELQNEVSTPNQQSFNVDLDKEIKALEDVPFKNPSMIQPDKPYGVLKNGIKPTYKSWSSQPNSPITNQPQNNLNQIMNEVISDNVNEYKPSPMIQSLEVKKVFQLGRNKKNRTVSVLLKNNSTRKKIEGDKVNFKKTNISTVKNFLKKQNLIKFGTTAPNNLLRDIYESTKLCGDITNENTKSIIHNFNEE